MATGPDERPWGDGLTALCLSSSCSGRETRSIPLGCALRPSTGVAWAVRGESVRAPLNLVGSALSLSFQRHRLVGVVESGVEDETVDRLGEILVGPGGLCGGGQGASVGPCSSCTCCFWI